MSTNKLTTLTVLRFFVQLNKKSILQTLFALYLIGCIVCFGSAYKDTERSRKYYYESPEYMLCYASETLSNKDNCSYTDTGVFFVTLGKTVFWPLFLSYKAFN